MPGFVRAPQGWKELTQPGSRGQSKGMKLRSEEEEPSFNHSRNNSWATGRFGLNYPPLPGTPSNGALVNAVHESNGLYNATKK